MYLTVYTTHFRLLLVSGLKDITIGLDFSDKHYTIEIPLAKNDRQFYIFKFFLYIIPVVAVGDDEDVAAYVVKYSASCQVTIEQDQVKDWGYTHRIETIS